MSLLDRLVSELKSGFRHNIKDKEKRMDTTLGSVNLTTKPWQHLEPDAVLEVNLPRGMIGDEERRSYHFLARFALKGEGAIVDAGAFIGSSGFCFASGLARNPHVFKGRNIIHSFDRFWVAEDYVGQSIRDSVRPIKAGERFRDIFDWQIGMFKEYFVVHEGDMLEQKWEGGRIDLLFIDIAKTAELNAHLIKIFFPSLIPGASLLIHQDFYHCWHPYIHISMEYLRHRFEILDSYISYHSRLYRLIQMPTEEEMQRMVAYDFSASERLALLDQFIANESGMMRGMAHCVKLCQLWMDSDVAGYDAARAVMATEFELAQSSELYAYQTRQLDELVAQLRKP